MLKVQPFMNSCAGDVLEFKTCCGLKMIDQNLEIHVTNESSESVKIIGQFDLVENEKAENYQALMPGGEQEIAAGETLAFYCYMDEEKWKKADELIFYGEGNNKYKVDLRKLERKCE